MRRSEVGGPMEPGSETADEPFDVALISVHGLIRSRDLELGRDPDTGGQTLYVVELARALGARPDVGQVDLVTRRVVDPAVSDDYARRLEPIAERARIVRIDCGPEGYIAKEELWDHLDELVDNLLSFYRSHGPEPDLVHSHYADAGYVGVRVSSHLGVPLVHTGHSLGRVKRRRLLASGLDADEIEERYHLRRRIEAEEETLAAAERVIVSTRNEIDEQYGLYDQDRSEKMRVVPPGTDLERFHPPSGDERDRPIHGELERFLRQPEKPIVLAIARPDERKNLTALVEAYGGSEELRETANLVIIAGNRDDIRTMEEGQARVLQEILLSLDANDLWGKIAIPKRHTASDVEDLYRLAAASRGVFVNPALTEPFGLTLIEAAASGLPLVATEDGGPHDIIANCRNGSLIDPLDPEAMAEAIVEILGDRELWDEMSASGLEGVEAHYSWPAHAESYLREVRPLLAVTEPRPRPPVERRPILFHDRALFAGLDHNLLGDPEALEELIAVLRDHRRTTTFGIATGRRLDSALRRLRDHGVPRPDVLITSVGTEIHYAPGREPDTAWTRHIDHLWAPRLVRGVLADLPGLELQPPGEQSRFKISYYYDPRRAPTREEVVALLHREDQAVNVFASFGQYLDIVPIRASKGLALRWFAEHWAIPLEQILVAGGTATDAEMMRGATLAAVVGEPYDEALDQLAGDPSVLFAERPYAAGILEAMEHYDFFGRCTVPEDAVPEETPPPPGE